MYIINMSIGAYIHNIYTYMGDCVQKAWHRQVPNATRSTSLREEIEQSALHDHHHHHHPHDYHQKNTPTD